MDDWKTGSFGPILNPVNSDHKDSLYTRISSLIFFSFFFQITAMVGDGGHRLSATCRSNRVLFFFFFFLVFRFWPFAKKSHPSSRLVGRPYATATQRSGLHVVASRRPSPTKRPKEEETRRHQQQQLLPSLFRWWPKRRVSKGVDWFTRDEKPVSLTIKKSKNSDTRAQRCKRRSNSDE